MPRLAVVIPMFDEEAGAERCVRAVCAVLAEKVPDARLFVVDDSSRDRTPAVLGRLASEGLPFDIVRHDRNRGYGAALMTGAREAHRRGFEFALFMDSDLTDSPALIPTFAEKLAGDRWDLVKASRYLSAGGMSGVPLYRRVVSVVGNQLASRLFRMNIRDCTSGFRAVRLSLITDLDFQESGFPFILEELLWLKRRGARATELPHVLTSRAGPSSFRYSSSTLYRYLKYAVQAALVRRTDP
jgi:dolichol-phosphate mannosyltransferase